MFSQLNLIALIFVVVGMVVAYIAGRSHKNSNGSGGSW